MTDSTNKKQARSFDMKKESERIAQALEKMKSTQKPGEAHGMGTKIEILMTMESEIIELVKAGWSVKQIALAISNDSFGILPKSITQIINRHSTARQKPTKRKPQEKTNMTQPEHVKAASSHITKAKQVTEIGDVE